MVRRLLIGLAALAWAGEAHGQAVDWRQAGGALFAGASLEIPKPSGAIGEASIIEPPDQPYAELIAAAAAHFGLDPKLLHALVAVESGYRPDALSSAGAAGLTQLMPATAAALGVRDRFDPLENIAGGAGYLARQIVRFGDLRLALAAYNAGPERVARLGRAPDIAETRAHVSAVVDCYLALAAGRSVRRSRDCRAAEGAP